MTNLLRHLDPEVMKSPAFSNPDFDAQVKSPEQGAATTVWAAVGEEWKQNGGKYLEDCRVAAPCEKKEDRGPSDPGYLPYAYDVESAQKLWEVSNSLVGLPKENS